MHFLLFQSIVFIDEIDAVGTKRYDSNSGGEREIQRTMLELLNQLDGFDSRGDVKVRLIFKADPTILPFFHYRCLWPPTASNPLILLLFGQVVLTGRSSSHFQTRKPSVAFSR